MPNENEDEEMVDGGPAFPEPVVVKQNLLVKARMANAHPGMNLRDFFAAKALAAILIRTYESGGNMENQVRDAFRYADLMLKERKNEPRPSRSRKNFEG